MLNPKIFSGFFSSVILTTCFFGLFIPATSRADINVIKQAIVDYNSRAHETSISDGTYRGEEGILLMKPEVARAFGLKVPEYPEYETGRILYKDAEKILRKTWRLLEARAKYRQVRREHILEIADSAVLYNETIAKARDKFSLHRLELDPNSDERLDYAISSALLRILLEESLIAESLNLRNSLGLFYNTCRGVNESDTPLTAANVMFVNYVFNAWKAEPDPSMTDEFDMDIHQVMSGDRLRAEWRSALDEEDSHILGMIETELEGMKNPGVSMDALLFLALIKQESRFDPENVSRVGAAGLTQIMPGTGKRLGMKQVFSPPYYDEAKELLGKERTLRRQAGGLLLKIDENNKLELTKKALHLMERSLGFQKRRKHLFEIYARELKTSGRDERLDPVKSIRYGLEYFLSMMELHKGDMSLALAAYNAGPHRVEQYKGIPPFSETVGFRNRVLKYYKDYLDRTAEYRINKGKGN